MSRLPPPDPPGPGQESVWDYPRPPRLEPVPERVRIVLDGVTIVDTTRSWRVLETSHPPTYYIPPDAIAPGAVRRVAGGSLCEWKGQAAYFDVVGRTSRIARGAWGYPTPTGPFRPITDHLAFYAGPMDACFVGDDRAVAQPGGFYGGWITPRIVGPFKGEPGTAWW